MLVEPVRVPARVVVDQAELRSCLLQYRLATLVSLAGDVFTIQELTLNVKIEVDGEDVFAAFEHVVTDHKGRVVRVVLIEETTDATYWYILVPSAPGELGPEQYRLTCEENGETYTLEPGSYLANSE